MASHWEEFYATHLPPIDFEDNRKLLQEFCERHNRNNERIVLITVSIVGYVCLLIIIINIIYLSIHNIVFI